MNESKKNKIASERLDVELVQRGLAVSREKAQAFIMAGDILVNGQVVYKSATKVTAEHTIQMKEKPLFVSRGAEKIVSAFEEFQLNVTNTRALDIGISTGGFTDYMLQHGALFVTGIDVNIQQVDTRLQSDPRVKLVKLNARLLQRKDVDYEPDIITIDVSFISILKILPALSVFPNAKIVTLIKPQFEAQPHRLGKGGIVRDKKIRKAILIELKNKIEELNYGVSGFIPAGVKGRKGNQEYFFLLEYGKTTSLSDTIITDENRFEI